MTTKVLGTQIRPTIITGTAITIDTINVNTLAAAVFRYPLFFVNSTEDGYEVHCGGKVWPVVGGADELCETIKLAVVATKVSG